MVIEPGTTSILGEEVREEFANVQNVRKFLYVYEIQAVRGGTKAERQVINQEIHRLKRHAEKLYQISTENSKAYKVDKHEEKETCVNGTINRAKVLRYIVKHFHSEKFLFIIGTDVITAKFMIQLFRTMNIVAEFA